MAITEKSLGRFSGLRNRQHTVHVFTTAPWVKDLGGVPALGFHERSTFTNKFMPGSRSVALRIVTDATVATRIVTLEVFGIDNRGKAVKSTLTVTAAASLTVDAHSLEVFADVSRLNVLVNTAVVAGDDVTVGVIYSQTLTKFGLPVDITGVADILSAYETSGALLTPVGLDISTMVFEATTMSVKMPSTVAAGDLVILNLRTTVD